MEAYVEYATSVIQSPSRLNEYLKCHLDYASDCLKALAYLPGSLLQAF